MYQMVNALRISGEYTIEYAVCEVGYEESMYRRCQCPGSGSFLQIFPERPLAAVQKEPGELHALSAVLMDGETGRVLYEKEGRNAKTKCQYYKGYDLYSCTGECTAGGICDSFPKSGFAAGCTAQYEGRRAVFMKDLPYSLMLKSHNDTAVAIAEHVGGQWKALRFL